MASPARALPALLTALFVIPALMASGQNQIGDEGLAIFPPAVSTAEAGSSYFASGTAVSLSDEIQPASALIPGQLASTTLNQPPFDRSDLIYTPRRRAASVRLPFFSQAARLRNLPLGFQFGGWLDSGITVNSRKPINPPTAPTGGNLPLTFNYRDRQGQLNQLYGFLQRPTDTTDRIFDIGGRLDLLFGEDYTFTQAVGLEQRTNGTNHWNTAVGGSGISGMGRHGLAMPQAYVETALGNWSTQVGHFYTILGYESVMAPENFFYSHSYAMQYGEPFTHTGALTTWQATDQMTLMGGATMGNNIFDAPVDRVSWLAGVNLMSADSQRSLSFSMTTGDEPLPFGFGGIFTPMTIYSLVYVNRLTDWFMVVIQHDAGFQSRGSAMPNRQGIQNAEWYGLNQYLITQLTDQLSAGLRLEWFNDDDGARVVNFAGHWYEVSMGLNWEPFPGMRVRPEMRWDWFDPHGAGTPAGPFDNNTQRSQFTAAVDTILIY